jgi:hypothetical protein
MLIHAIQLPDYAELTRRRSAARRRALTAGRVGRESWRTGRGSPGYDRRPLAARYHRGRDPKHRQPIVRASPRGPAPAAVLRGSPLLAVQEAEIDDFAQGAQASRRRTARCARRRFELPKCCCARLVGRHDAIETHEVEHRAHGAMTAARDHERELAASLVELVRGSQKDADDRRVDERAAGQVDDHAAATARGHKRRIQLLGRGEVRSCSPRSVMIAACVEWTSAWMESCGPTDASFVESRLRAVSLA